MGIINSWLSDGSLSNEKFPGKSFVTIKGLPRLIRLKGIGTNVFILGLVSFFTDVSSDMIYPLLPVFLMQSLGMNAAFVGLVEGFAESTTAFFTLFSGYWADRARDRSRLVAAGYGLASFVRPLVAFATAGWMVFLVRVLDRVGKGIRTAPRDSLIADSVAPENRGKAYGLQRSMDHAGAVVGPIIATALLASIVTDVRTVFLLAGIPAAIAITLVFWKVREVVPGRQAPERVKIGLGPPSGKLGLYLLILFIFVLSCSSDAFLLLRAKELGVPVAFLPVLWMTFNLIKALSTLPFGSLSDKIGRRRVIFAGWIVYALVYAGFAVATEPVHAWMLFAGYGFFYGLTEGSERAILADYADPHQKGQAFGWYYFIVGMGALPASLFFGWVQQKAGSPTAFLLSASISTTAAVCLYIFMKFFPSSKPSLWTHLKAH